jgi:hypothetical protein
VAINCSRLHDRSNPQTFVAGVDDALLGAPHCRLLDGGRERANGAFDLERIKYHVQLCKDAATFHPNAVVPVDHDFATSAA